MNELFVAGILPALFIGILVIIFTIAIWLILRPVWCWYLKIDERIELLSEIRDLLESKNLNQEDKTTNETENNSNWETLGDKIGRI